MRVSRSSPQPEPVIACALLLAFTDLASWTFALEIVSFALTLVLNILSTSEYVCRWHRSAALTLIVSALIILKLSRVRARVSSISTTPDKWLRIIRIIMESGFLYTVTVLILVCTLPITNVSGCVSAVVVQVIVSSNSKAKLTWSCTADTHLQSIAFNLITIRVHGASESSTAYDEDTSSSLTLPSSSRQMAKASEGGNTVSLTSLNINMNTHT